MVNGECSRACDKQEQKDDGINIRYVADLDRIVAMNDKIADCGHADGRQDHEPGGQSQDHEDWYYGIREGSYQIV